jgi:hypothetical protein
VVAGIADYIVLLFHCKGVGKTLHNFFLHLYMYCAGKGYI